MIRIHVPDAQSIASDYVLETSGEDAMQYALGLNAFDENYTSRMHELLDTGELDLAYGISPISGQTRHGIKLLVKSKCLIHTTLW